MSTDGYYIHWFNFLWLLENFGSEISIYCALFSLQYFFTSFTNTCFVNDFFTVLDHFSLCGSETVGRVVLGLARRLEFEMSMLTNLNSVDDYCLSYMVNFLYCITRWAWLDYFGLWSSFYCCSYETGDLVNEWSSKSCIVVFLDSCSVWIYK